MKSNLHKSLLVCGEYLSSDAVVVVGELPDKLLLGVECGGRVVIDFGIVIFAFGNGNLPGGIDLLFEMVDLLLLQLAHPVDLGLSVEARLENGRSCGGSGRLDSSSFLG